MAKPSLISAVAFLLLILGMILTVDAGADELVWVSTVRSELCDGSMGECLGGEMDEFAMDSEINRRILATNKYISYGALQRNSVPCSRRGASYYNCKSGAQANPYNRGCSAITRCRS